MAMFRRMYHVSSMLFNTKKLGMKLNKMINPKTKKQWYPSEICYTNTMPSVKSLTKTKNEPGKRGQRRVAVLNKMFMKYITDIMSTGTVAMNVVGKGIELSKVRLTPDFQTLSVYWVSKGELTDKDTESLLNSVAGVLRHELSTLRLMGEVPYIVFVKDRQEAQVADLDQRLSIADFGEDYTPTDLGHLLKTDFTLDTRLSPEMKAKITKLEEDLSVVDDPIPEMTHNVYGLDHLAIMNRLVAARKKNREAWSSFSEGNVISYRNSDVTQPAVDTVKQKKDIAEFLLRRQILQNKLHKQKRDVRDSLIVAGEEKVKDELYEFDFDDEEDEYYEDYDDPYYDNEISDKSYTK